MSSDPLSFLAGFISGFMSGLLPGLHSNTVIAILDSVGFDKRSMAMMIIALYPAHLISSFIPSIFFGVPEPDTAVSVLPGQRMVMRGRGISALRTVLLSSLIAAALSAALFWACLEMFPLLYGAVRDRMGFILLAVSAVFLIRSRRPAAAAAVFLSSGVLGYFTLNSGMEDPFLPLFSGSFAMAAIMNYRKGAVPPQEDAGPLGGFAAYTCIGVVLGMAADMIPGVGSPSQVATFAGIFVPVETAGYLALISAISVSQAIFSLATEASIGKSRVGATAWLSRNIQIGANLPLLLALFVLSLAMAAMIVFALRKRISGLAGLDFARFNIVLAAYIAAITVIIDGLPGLAVLAVSSALGLLALRSGAERTNLMGAIIFPTMLLLLRIFP
jgi:putative membrane protein